MNASGWPQEWIPLTQQENAEGGLGRYGMGGTNVVEYAPGKGLVWFLKNDRGGSGCHCIVGAGVATVTADAGGARATRAGTGVMWNGATEPHWGDVGVTYDPRDGKVYVGYTDIMVMTAPNLEGPWTKAFTVASTCPGNQCGAVRYAIAPHPEYDPTGRTLPVTWTDANVIHSARLHWR
ncbi:hypothetical protein AB0J72_57200 [Dactylosporangium sp. NPDC049742]|uniref:hypothetical protein n=1 Tax=Dactylosporangium sp. NPDC049742 TaxID=3154737 RepID=UPI00343C2B55